MPVRRYLAESAAQDCSRRRKLQMLFLQSRPYQQNRSFGSLHCFDDALKADECPLTKPSQGRSAGDVTL